MSKTVVGNSVEIHLPYHKQGDDLAWHLSKTDTPAAAMRRHAECLDDAAQMLRDVAQIIEGSDCDVQADTHCIWLGGPTKIKQQLVKAKLATVMVEFEDEDEDETE